MFSIEVSIGTHDPVIVHAWERGILAFHVHDPADGRRYPIQGLQDQ